MLAVCRDVAHELVIASVWSLIIVIGCTRSQSMWPARMCRPNVPSRSTSTFLLRRFDRGNLESALCVAGGGGKGEPAVGRLDQAAGGRLPFLLPSFLPSFLPVVPSTSLSSPLACCSL